ncbi:MAG: multiheme c-type cytochrome [Pseudomonadota bacterium]
MKTQVRLLFSIIFLIPSLAWAEDCVECHRQTTPSIVTDWLASKHSGQGISCENCHGKDHVTKEDVANAKLPLPETCGTCHNKQLTQFKSGKHSLAWAAVKIMPPTHQLPMAQTWGTKGCAACHKVGIKTEDDIREMKTHGPGYGVASCDACHTRHMFSAEEARQPQACQSCHSGSESPHWEMYSASKHGIRAQLKQNGKLPETASAPTCQTCHMQQGNHEVRTAWGYLAIRLPISGDAEDNQWKEDQQVILRALGLMDADGKYTERQNIIKAADVARLSKEEWQVERDKMVRTCNECHSNAFSTTQLKQGDEMVKQADHLLADALRIIAGLYKDGILEKPPGQIDVFPDLLTVHDAPRTPIEQKLFTMFLKHRTRAIQGTFHNNADYALWQGWAEMVQDLTQIKNLAQALRNAHSQKAESGSKKSDNPS